MDKKYLEDLTRKGREHIWQHYVKHVNYGDSDNFNIGVGGEGNYFLDPSGKRYLDATGGFHCCLVGHGRSEIIDAVNLQMQSVEYVGSGILFTTIPTIELAAKLAELTPGDLRVSYFSLSGTEAIEGALKMAIQYQAQGGFQYKHKVLFRDGSHHGFTFGAMSVSGDPGIRSPIFERLVSPIGVVVPSAHPYKCDYCDGACNLGCAKAVESTIQYENPDTVAAFMMEPIAKGAIIPHPEYWPMIDEICKKYGILIIADEVVTAFGRTGVWFASNHWGIEPEIMVLGKTLASGYQPIGAIVTTTKVANAFTGQGNNLKMAHTLAGHPAGTVASLANLRIIEDEGLVDYTKQMGTYLHEGLKTLLKYEIVGEVRCIGLLGAVDLVKNKETKEPLGGRDLGHAMMGFMLDNGLYLTSGGSRLEIHPCLTISKKEVDELISVLDKTMAYIETWISSQ